MTASLVISGLLLLAMAAAAGYALVVLPAGASVPVHAGTPERSLWLSKRAGLAVWLAAGAACFATLGALTSSGLAANWAVSMRVTLAPAVMCVVLAAEIAAIITARRAAQPSVRHRDSRRQEHPAGGGARGGADGDRRPRGHEQAEQRG